MLKLSTKGRYATRIMVYLATREGQGNVRKHEVATAEGISRDYAEQLLVKLKTAGLVASHRGVGGGFTLARPADRITVADVLRATEGPICLVPCETCERATACVTRALWQKADSMLGALFAETTIKDLAEEANALTALTFDI